MKTLSSDRDLSLLAIQRIAWLRPSEKLSLLGLLDSGIGLSFLSHADVESAIGRCLPSRSWNPQILLAEAEGDALLLERLGAGFASIADPDYPAALREIAQPPFGLYRRGRALSSALPAISIVGTRYPSGLGLVTALSLAGEFGKEGIPVVSGLAKGIDGAAHRGCLRSGGQTCAVLPCGVEAVYPASNRGLAAAILESGGLLLSEYPPGTEIRKSRFPERNRIISGLSRGLVVIEAPGDSGALITADFALDQGRDVYVASACMEGPKSLGLDRLVSEGARAICHASEVLGEWGLGVSAVPTEEAGCPQGSGPETFSLFGHDDASSSLAAGRGLALALRAELGLSPGAGRRGKEERSPMSGAAALTGRQDRGG